MTLDMYIVVIGIVLPAVIVGIFGYMFAVTNRQQAIELGQLREKLGAIEHLELTFSNEIREKELTISEKDDRIEDQQIDLLDKKDAIRSYRAVVNRHEGRIVVFESNEITLRDEVISLRNRVMVEESKSRFLERENNELRNELIAIKAKTEAPALDI